MFATNILHVGPTGFGLLMSAPGLGATVAALSLASVTKLRVGLRWISFCVLGFAVSLALFAFSHSFILSCIFLAMVGLFQIAARASANTAIQIETPTHLLGRVLSLFFMDRGLWSLGSMLIGAAAAIIGIAWTLTACASLCALAAARLLVAGVRHRQERREQGPTA